MDSTITSPTPPSPPRSPRFPKSSSTLPPTLHTSLVDAGTTNHATNISARTLQDMKKKEATVSKVQVQRPVRAQFILKLHSIITLPNAEIIQWSNDGRAFTINYPALFEEKLLPEIFAHSNYASFERQLHFYS